MEQEQFAAELEVQTLWFQAAGEGKYKKLESFLEKETITDPDVRDGLGGGAMHHAARAGHKKCVRALLRANVSVDTQDKEGLTALHLALAGSHQVCVCVYGCVCARACLWLSPGLVPLSRIAIRSS